MQKIKDQGGLPFLWELMHKMRMKSTLVFPKLRLPEVQMWSHIQLVYLECFKFMVSRINSSAFTLVAIIHVFIFRKENVQFSSRRRCLRRRRRSFCPEIAHDAHIYCRAVSTLITANVRASPRLGSQWWWDRIPLFALFLLIFNVTSPIVQKNWKMPSLLT